MNIKPSISIVGAGPGDPDLITVKGLKAIQSADVILYDALVNKDVLKNAKKGIKMIYVGKRCGQHSLTQDDINLLIVQSAFQYGHAVRLKGGDPFIFGRGHEELEYIRSFDIKIEVVPGISSATSLPLLEEVPLTKRNVSESFWVLTGTTKDHQLSRDFSLAAQSSATLVILMGMKKIDRITTLLKEKGKGHLPLLIIQNGSGKNHHSIVSTVDEICHRKGEILKGAPGILIIGEVVALHPEFVIEKAISSWA